MSKVAEIYTRSEANAQIDELAFESHLEEIKNRRDEFHQKRHIPRDVVSAWQAFGSVSYTHLTLPTTPYV